MRRLFSKTKASTALGKNSVCAALATFAGVFNRLREAARCSVLWMLTEFHDEFPAIYPDFLRKLDLGDIFASGSSASVQSLVLLIASKVWHYHAASKNEASQSKRLTLIHPFLGILPRLEILVDHIFRLGIFKGTELQVRDLAFTLTTLFGASLSGISLGQNIFGSIRVETGAEVTLDRSADPSFPCNSLSHVIGKPMTGLRCLPEFSGEKHGNLRDVSLQPARTVAISSSQSSAVRVSSSVALPANLKTPVPKAPASLAELDLFFSDTPSVAPLAVIQTANVPIISSAAPTMDLATAADLFRN